MLITDAQIQRIAQLARIETNASETAELQQQLSGIFTLIEAMQAVNTTGIEPMAHAQDVTQRLRDDRVTEPDQREALLANAPESEAGLYLVPKVIE